MTWKEINKKLNNLRRQMSEVEKEIIMKKINEGKKKSALAKEYSSWEKLRKKVTEQWDNKYTAVEEIRDQRTKGI